MTAFSKKKKGVENLMVNTQRRLIPTKSFLKLREIERDKERENVLLERESYKTVKSLESLHCLS